MGYQWLDEILMITLTSSKKLGVYRILTHTVSSHDHLNFDYEQLVQVQIHCHCYQYYHCDKVAQHGAKIEKEVEIEFEFSRQKWRPLRAVDKTFMRTKNIMVKSDFRLSDALLLTRQNLL